MWGAWARGGVLRSILATPRPRAHPPSLRKRSAPHLSPTHPTAPDYALRAAPRPQRADLRSVVARLLQGEKKVNIHPGVASAAAILHRLGRPGAIRLGTTPTGTPTRLPTRLAPLDATLDDAIRATDLLLAAGGMALVVLDVAESPPHPHVHWTRLARAAERTRTALLVVSKRPHAGVSAALTLEVTARRVRWSGGPGRRVLLDGLTCRVMVARNRLGPPGGAIVLRQACA